MAESLLITQLEAILFVATEPLSTRRLAGVLDKPTADVEAALNELATRLSGGIRLSQLHGRYRLVTAPEAAEIVGNFLQDEQTTEISRPALETLAIIAYRGPLTKSQIESIRGVASENMLRGLQSRGLIIEAGRSSEPGRPKQYAVSHAFMQHFGLTSPKDLPIIPDITSANQPSGPKPDEN